MTVADGVLPSIWHLPPPDQGGPIARQGFDFQDHVGVNLCIAMLCDDNIVAICFETHDDLVVHWSNDVIEFVQVKSDSPDRLLSIAWLCKDKEKSVLARSLAREACKEYCCFRIVTKQGISQELEPLKTPRERRVEPILSSIATLGLRIARKLKGTKSPKGSGAESWVKRTLWEVQHSEDALIAKSRVSLDNALEELGYPLRVADRDALYEEMLKVARSTAVIIYKGDLTEGSNKATNYRSRPGNRSKREKWSARIGPAPGEAECGRINNPGGLRSDLSTHLLAEVVEIRLHTALPFRRIGSGSPAPST